MKLVIHLFCECHCKDLDNVTLPPKHMTYDNIFYLCFIINSVDLLNDKPKVIIPGQRLVHKVEI